MKYSRILMVFVLLFSSVFAVNVVIMPDKQIYGPNEVAKISVLVANEKSDAADLTVQFYVLLPYESTTLGQTRQITVGPSSSETILFNYTVSLNDPPGEYTAAVSYFTSEGYSEKTATFEVAGTTPPVVFNIISCRDSTCSNAKKTFIAGETVYIKVQTDLSDFVATATLKMPDGATQAVSFSNNLASVQITTTGLYEVTATLSKEGYSDTTKTLQFAAIGENVQISSASKCNANGICDSGETIQNCPQDCTLAKLDYLQYIQWGIIAFLAVFVIILLAKRRPN